MLPAALALALAATPLVPDEAEPATPDEAEEWLQVERDPRLDLTAWGGQAWTQEGSNLRSGAWGAEATWRFDTLDLGLYGGAYGLRYEGADGRTRTSWAPVYLLRFGQRFETRNGLLAAFTFGVGGLRDAAWRSWFQVALGARARFGPAFVGGELSFESENFVRVALGLGVSLL